MSRAPVDAAITDAGRDLFVAGLVSVRGGNISVRLGDGIRITRTGSSLAHLRPTDFATVPIDPSATAHEQPVAPSSDLEVHRAIYTQTGANAVVHAHCPSAVVLSFGHDLIEPADFEGKLFIPRVAVVDEDTDRRTLGSRIAGALASAPPIAVARTHGTYAIGDDPEAAANWTTNLELSCRILLGLRDRGAGPPRDS